MDSKKDIKPNIILGLDISTACIGVSIVYDDGVNEPQIQKITHVVPKVKKNIKGIEALILRKEIFEKEFLETIKDIGITECVIESPLTFATGNSNPQTVSQLLQFNGLLSEAVYRVLHIIPQYISSHDARMMSFPELLSIRRYNKKGVQYPYKKIRKDIKDNHLVLFGSYPFDCDKKLIMMNLVSEKYPEINWVKNKNGVIKKENFDACDSLVCVLAYINKKRNGDIKPEIVTCDEVKGIDFLKLRYTVKVWDMNFNKTFVFS